MLAGRLTALLRPPLEASERHNGATVTWVTIGVGLIGAHLALLWLSFRFEAAVDPTFLPVFPLSALLVAAGLLYLSLFWVAGRFAATRGLVLWMLFVGLALRLLLLPSPPIFEDDFYRYLWDGGVTAQGFNPYAFAPETVLADSDAAVPLALHQLAQASGPVAEWVNYPSLTTIYPPLAQAGFALAHLIEPWSLIAWRGVSLGFELITLGLLALLLRRLGRSPLWLALYWWNPLAVKELVNSAHMESLLLPFLLAALLAALSARPRWTAVFAALAVGVKLWPIILLPALFRPFLQDRKALLSALGIFLTLAALLLAPMALARLDGSAGVVAYSQEWRMNDSLFAIICNTLDRFFPFLNTEMWSRLLVLALLGLVVLALTWRTPETPEDTLRSALWTVAALFLLSPTQYPWYYLWLLPFLVLVPRLSLLSLTALLPLYYLRFHFEATGQPSRFDNGVVWIEFAPVWLLLAAEAIAAQRMSSNPPVARQSESG